MSEWEITIHVDDEETARNMMEELSAEGFGVTLYKKEVRPTVSHVLQYSRLPNRGHNAPQAEV